MSETYIHDSGKEFKALPEVYQIEACSACNLKCPMCLRTTDMVRPDQLLKLDLVKTMHERGDFRGSFYVELQMAGEPTLHPQLWELIDYLKHKVGVMVGLSTHGLQIRKSPQVKAALMMLDALTISVDSIHAETYHKMRFPATIDQLMESLSVWFFMAQTRAQAKMRIPFTELQLVNTPLIEGSGHVQDLVNLMQEKGWDKYASIRTTYDCFIEMQGRQTNLKRNSQLCLNPFQSVSVAANGDVVSCCYIFEPKKTEMNYYGNLYENSLEEIWYSPRVEAMRQMHIQEAAGHGQLKDQCGKCYLKSPCFIHQNIVSRLVRLG